MLFMIIALTIVQLISAIAIVVIVLFQSGKSAGLSGAIGGVADTFFAKNKAKTIDAKLARYTKYVALLFVLLTLLLNILG
jgi:preprotein translocase subunit SecG